MPQILMAMAPADHAVAVAAGVGVMEPCHGAAYRADLVCGEHRQKITAAQAGLFCTHAPHVPFAFDEGVFAVHLDDVVFHLFVGCLGLLGLFLFVGEAAHQCFDGAVCFGDFALEELDGVGFGPQALV